MSCRSLRLSGLAIAIAMAAAATSANAESFNRIHSFSTADNLPKTEQGARKHQPRSSPPRPVANC